MGCEKSSSKLVNIGTKQGGKVVCRIMFERKVMSMCSSAYMQGGFLTTLMEPLVKGFKRGQVNIMYENEKDIRTMA